MSSTNEHCLVFIAALDLAPHGGPVHDAQLDHHGKRLATASADQSIRIWDVSTERPSFVAELKGHAGPVWQVTWSHPKFGSCLASCGSDKRVHRVEEGDGHEPRGRGRRRAGRELAAGLREPRPRGVRQWGGLGAVAVRAVSRFSVV
uniref:Anaphase-promoting complex subunit 4 WD40 domain-containing protein n=1 Tax=Vitrella brassicaformis TaxID=1169539 RepID=A0A7S1P0S6_9ALVE|mmetsp:Transcript_21252/g.51916  ORF Transcript_21252/g.51916 Transcript_21252/m.51916 type:complete len:147 (+) Transcript_21252:91-531(+)